MIDSGVQLFFSGQYYYRQVGELAVNVCAAREITDAAWLEYLEKTHALSQKIGTAAKVSAITFAHGHLNAAQRRMSTKFMADNGVPKVERIAVFTENVMLRGAMTALSWFLPETTLRPFAGNEVRAGLEWLREKARFDPALALDAWREGHSRLGLQRSSLRP